MKKKTLGILSLSLVTLLTSCNSLKAITPAKAKLVFDDIILNMAKNKEELDEYTLRYTSYKERDNTVLSLDGLATANFENGFFHARVTLNNKVGKEEEQIVDEQYVYNVDNVLYYVDCNNKTYSTEEFETTEEAIKMVKETVNLNYDNAISTLANPIYISEFYDIQENLYDPSFQITTQQFSNKEGHLKFVLKGKEKEKRMPRQVDYQCEVENYLTKSYKRVVTDVIEENRVVEKMNLSSSLKAKRVIPDLKDYTLKNNF